MLKTTYDIPKMDCPSEERIIRMKLENFSEIKQLKFDLENRRLEVIHLADNPEIEKALESLNFGAQKVKAEKISGSEVESDHGQQKKLLWMVLLINFIFFVLEITTGIISKSMGLIADSLDMLADATVYMLSLWAVGASLARKKKVAMLSGYFQLLLAFLGMVEVIRRFFGHGETPNYKIMIIVAFFALLANVLSLYILQKSKSNEAHMKASMIFTSNDIIINTGVIAAGILVMLTRSKYPDLIIGAIIFVLVVQGAFRILKLAK